MTWQLLLDLASKHQHAGAAAVALAVLGGYWLRIGWEYGRRGRCRAPVRWYTLSGPGAAERPGAWDLRELRRRYRKGSGGGRDTSAPPSAPAARVRQPASCRPAQAAPSAADRLQ